MRAERCLKPYGLGVTQTVFRRVILSAYPRYPPAAGQGQGLGCVLRYNGISSSYHLLYVINGGRALARAPRTLYKKTYV